MVRDYDVVAALESEFKRRRSVFTLVDLANELVSENEIETEAHERGVSLLKRAVKQYKSSYAITELLMYYIEFHSLTEQESINELWETLCSRRRPSANAFYNLGLRLVYGNFGEKEEQRGLGLLRRAVHMEKRNVAHLTALSRALMRCEPNERTKREAIALFVKAIKLSKSRSLMHELSNLFEMGTQLFQPCSKCAAKWRRRALRAANA